MELKKVCKARAEVFLSTTKSQNDNSDDGVIERKAKYCLETNLNLFFVSMVKPNLVYYV